MESAHAILAGRDPADEISFAMAFNKLWSVHLNDQNGLKYDQDKSFGAVDLRGAYNQVRVLELAHYAQTGRFGSARAEVNRGRTLIPDERLDWLSAHYSPKKTTPTSVDFLDVPGITPGSADKASAGLIADLRTQLEDGADFDELARQFSDDKSSAARGGDLGWAEPGNFVPAFESVMNALRIDEMLLARRQGQVARYLWCLLELHRAALDGLEVGRVLDGASQLDAGRGDGLGRPPVAHQVVDADDRRAGLFRERHRVADRLGRARRLTSARDRSPVPNAPLRRDGGRRTARARDRRRGPGSRRACRARRCRRPRCAGRARTRTT
mgnify:CR=1 FL=1